MDFGFCTGNIKPLEFGMTIRLWHVDSLTLESDVVIPVILGSPLVVFHGTIKAYQIQVMKTLGFR